MYRLILFVVVAAFVANCTPKLATKGEVKDYTEDVSAFRPKLEIDDTGKGDESTLNSVKGPYVAPTHSINAEMSTIMDSIIVYNRDRTYITYTIQVYIGRNREEANQVREKVYRVLPEDKPQLSYKQPSYKVNVGRYFDRAEAYKTLTLLRSSFPGATLVREYNRVE